MITQVNTSKNAYDKFGLSLAPKDVCSITATAYYQNLADVCGEGQNFKLNNSIKWWTPHSVVAKIYSKFPITSTDEILVMFDMQMLIYAVSAGYSSITFLPDNAGQKSIAETYFKNVKVLDVCYNNIKTLKEQLKMKFNVIVGNPPYKKGMHLKIIDAVFGSLADDGHFVFIHPAEWLVQKRRNASTKMHRIVRDLLSTRKVDIEFINNPWKEVRLYVPLTITYASRGNEKSFTDSRTRAYSNTPFTPKSTVTLDNLFDVTQFGEVGLVKSILNKIQAHQDTWQIRAKQYVGDFYVNLSSIAGDGKTIIQYDDGVERTVYNMWSLINNTSLDVTTSPGIARPQGGKEVGNEKCWFSFKSMNEAQNALNFIKSSVICRMLIAIFKIDQHADSILSEIPWMDWAEVWTDKKLCEYFGITGEEYNCCISIVDTISIK